MPLVKLQSDLVWRGPKPNFTPDTPIPNDSESRFIPPKAGKGAPMTPGLAVKPPVVRVEGIGVNGRPYFIKYITAKDDFPTKNSMFDMGIAKRSAQGGEGYPFPKSYKGEIYQWKPEPHTGFYETNRYEDLAVPSGDRRGFLRETYLSNTPIEDVYNRFNLREDSYNSSYIKEPYILRGIQREGSIDPQRWGGFVGNTAGSISSLLNFPRSGPLSYGDRAVNDLVRIGKFLISPKGISFLVTQFGLQLMNPNVENRDGDVRTPLTEYKSNTKTFSPINLIANTAASGLGIRLPRHGILGKGYDETYEEVIKTRGTGELATNLNRLVKLRDEMIRGSDALLGNVWGTLSAPTGTKSFLGIGTTNIRRYEDTRIIHSIYPTDYRYNSSYKSIAKENSEFKPTKNLNASAGYETATEDFITYVADDDPTFGPENADATTGTLYLTRDNNLKQRLLHDTTKYPNYSPGNTRIKTSNPDGVDDSYPGSKNNPNFDDSSLQKYSTLAYGKIPAKSNRGSSSGIKQYNFIDDLEPNKYRPPGTISGSLTDVRGSSNKNGFDNNNGIIKFRFAKYPGGDSIYFRAYLSSINDRFGPQWEAEKLQNSAFNRYMYNSFDRSISISFVVTVESIDELEPVYKKLKDLANLTMPVLSKDNPPLGNFVEVTIGDLFNGEVMLIDSLSYSIDNETPWEITAGTQAPKYITVDVDFTYIGKQLSCAGSPVYSINTVE